MVSMCVCFYVYVCVYVFVCACVHVCVSVTSLHFFHCCTASLEVKSAVELPHFEMGDMVEVVEGGLTAVQGQVIKMDGTRITVKPVHREFDTLVFEAYALKKFFKLGGWNCAKGAGEVWW